MKTKAAVLYETGQPLRVEEVSVLPLQLGQVLVRVEFSGVCHSQLMEARGKRGKDRYLPHLLGHEGSGEVIKIGPKVKKVAPGDKVVLTWVRGNGQDVAGTQFRKNDLNINAGGVTTFSTLTVVSENRCVKIPEDIPLDVASLLGCALLTGAGIVFNTMKPLQGQSMLVWGAGGIGLSALIAAKICECEPIIAVDISDEKLSLAIEFGATHAIHSVHEDAPARVREIVGSAGVDFAVEAAGKTQTIEEAYAAVKKGGGLCVFASHPAHGEKICLDPHHLISGKRIEGSWGGDSKPDEDIPRLMRLYKQGLLPLEKMITHRYSLEEINQALDDLEQGKVGRGLIEMEGPDPRFPLKD